MASFLAIVAFFIVDIALEFLSCLSRAHTPPNSVKVTGLALASVPKCHFPPHIMRTKRTTLAMVMDYAFMVYEYHYRTRPAAAAAQRTVSTLFTTVCANVSCQYVWHTRYDCYACFDRGNGPFFNENKPTKALMSLELPLTTSGESSQLSAVLCTAVRARSKISWLMAGSQDNIVAARAHRCRHLTFFLRWNPY